MKWPHLTKLYVFYECFQEVIAASLPTEINVTRDVTYTTFMIYFNFWLCYFDLVSGMIATTLALIPVYVKRSVFHHEETVDLLINFSSMWVWQCLSLWFIHMLVTKVGMIYIDAEVLREGND